MDNDRTLYTSLAFVGALPFVACALLPLAGISSFEPIGRLDALVNSYGLAIICFLAGIHWATALMRPRQTPFNLLVGSNIVVLITWFAFVLADTNGSLLTQLIALAVLLLIDRWLATMKVISLVLLPGASDRNVSCLCVAHPHPAELTAAHACHPRQSAFPA